ncbi:hypothetical protein ACLMJK_007201 [Lecanora helva]
MGKKRKELSHAEVWDDSVLLQSWSDALEEYKLYHSIHARGERVEDVIQKFESDSNDHMNGDFEPSKNENDSPLKPGPDTLEDGELEEESTAAGAVSIKDSEQKATLHSLASNYHEQPLHPEHGSGHQHKASSGMPDYVTNGVQDQALKNLMMSWYWAGYHTGFYEGQQEAQRSTST